MGNEIGIRIAKLREEKGLSQNQLAKELTKTGPKVIRTTVTQWENGTRDLKTEYTIRLAEFFNVSADYILGLSSVKTRNETVQSIHEETGLWGDAIVTLMTNKYVDDHEISDFISYFITSKKLQTLIRSIKKANECSEKQLFNVDLEHEVYSSLAKSLFKSIASDVFLEVVEGYNAKPGEIMIGRMEGSSNG